MKYEQPIIEKIIFRDENIITSSPGIEDGIWDPNSDSENNNGEGI